MAQSGKRPVMQPGRPGQRAPGAGSDSGDDQAQEPAAGRARRDAQYRAALGLAEDETLPAQLGTVGGSRGGRGAARINQSTTGRPASWHTEARRAAATWSRHLDDDAPASPDPDRSAGPGPSDSDGPAPQRRP